jgi:hypothetical protein
MGSESQRVIASNDVDVGYPHSPFCSVFAVLFILVPLSVDVDDDPTGLCFGDAVLLSPHTWHCCFGVLG